MKRYCCIDIINKPTGSVDIEFGFDNSISAAFIGRDHVLPYWWQKFITFRQHNGDISLGHSRSRFIGRITLLKTFQEKF